MLTDELHRDEMEQKAKEKEEIDDAAKGNCSDQKQR